MNVEKYILGFVILSVFVVAGTFVLNNINQNYGEFGANLDNSSFNRTYNSIETTYNISKEMNEQVVGGELTEGSIIDSSLKGALTAARQVRSTFSLFNAIIQDVAKAIGIPPFFFTFAVVAVTIMIIFGLITIILRFSQ